MFAETSLAVHVTAVVVPTTKLPFVRVPGVQDTVTSAATSVASVAEIGAGYVTVLAPGVVAFTMMFVGTVSTGATESSVP